MKEALRLFLLEDDDNIALLVNRVLTRAGYEVVRCRSGADALIVLGHSTFDLIVLDQRLPDMAGLELLEQLAREGITTPALMVTGFGDEHLATRVLRAGALDYLVKDPELSFLNELPKRVHESVTRHRLLQSNLLLIEALESARDGIMITDLQGKILHVNQALEKMTGYSRAELLGQTPRIFKSGKHTAEVYAEIWRTILARASWQGELINRRKDGSPLEVSLTVSPILDGRGQLTHFVGIQRDMTDQKLLQRQLLQAQKMQSVGTLAGGIAHEFNNLLAGISGYASLAQREPNLPAKAGEFLHQVTQLAERAAGLTRQMLAFARKPSLTRHPTVVADLVRATADLVRHTLRVEVEVDLRAGASEDGALLVEADANQLQQALVNLTLNARDAMAAPGPVSYRLRPLLLTEEVKAFPETIPPGDYVVVEVIDRGCGMPPDVLGQALDPFFTTKQVGQGTGLGLPVVLGIVQAHQGFLRLHSCPGVGTTVALYLRRFSPQSIDLDDTFGKPVCSEVLEPEQVPGRHILVLDDEHAVLDVVRRFLEIAGHRVTCVTREQEALTLLSDDPSFDLLILDLLVQTEEGMQALHRVRQKRPRLPLLLCSGSIELQEAGATFGPGPVQLLRKPFRMNELWYAVNQAFGLERSTSYDSST